MFNLYILSFVVSAVILALAYIIVCTLNGFLQTWVIDKLGDPTAKNQGYLTLNPEMHVDLIGFIACVLFAVGWHMPVPIDAHRIKGVARLLRVMVAYLTSTACAVGLGILSLVLSIALFGEYATYRFLAIASKTETIDFNQVLGSFEGYRSIVVIIGILIASSILLNVYIAVLNLIYNAVRYILFIGVEKSFAYANHSESILSYGSLAALFIFREFFSHKLLMIIVVAADKITHLLGIVS